MRSQVLLRHLDITAEEAQLFQRLGTRLFYDDSSLRAAPEVLAKNTSSQPALWAHGISGDHPIVLVRIANAEETDLARQLIRAHEYWRLKGVSVDLVIVNDDPSGYFQPVVEQIHRLIAASPSQGLVDKPGGVFVRRGDQLSESDTVLLQTVARAILVGGRGTLARQIERPPALDLLPATFTPVSTPSGEGGAVPASEPRRLLFANGIGGFTPDGREYVVNLAERQYTPCPWSNVVAEEEFGFLVTESGSACTWAANSHENRLTPWSNSPSATRPEAIYLRDAIPAPLVPTARPIRDPSRTSRVTGTATGSSTARGPRFPIHFVPAAGRAGQGRSAAGDQPRKVAPAPLGHVLRRMGARDRSNDLPVHRDRARSGHAGDPGLESLQRGIRNPHRLRARLRRSRRVHGRPPRVPRSQRARRRPRRPAAHRAGGRFGAGLDPCAALQSPLVLARGIEGRRLPVAGAGRAAAASVIRRFQVPESTSALRAATGPGTRGSARSR
jgi:hypothetical protein